MLYKVAVSSAIAVLLSLGTVQAQDTVGLDPRVPDPTLNTDRNANDGFDLGWIGLAGLLGLGGLMGRNHERVSHDNVHATSRQRAS